MQSVDDQNSSPSGGFTHAKSLSPNRASKNNSLSKLYGDSSDLLRMLLAAAHGVNIPAKVVAIEK